MTEQPIRPPLHQRKIPGILGLLVVLFGVGLTVYLAGTTTHFFGRAAPSETPSDIRITNVTDTSFTLTYLTDGPYIGTLALDADTQVQTILDDRDQKSGTPQPYTVHSISAKNLQLKTHYTFSVLSGTTTFLNNGEKFSVTTGDTLSSAPSLQTPLAGKIIAADGSSPQEALIFATSSNGQTLSTLIQPSGLYILPLNTMRTKELSSYVALTPDTVVQVLVALSGAQAHALIALGNSNPVPAITLGQDYDFTLSATPIASTSAVGGFPEFSLDTTLKATPQILNPATQDQGFTDQQPLFKGTALPNQEVTVTIHSDQVITQTVTADTSGNWSFRPNVPLSPGEHTITISTVNKAGIIQSIKKSFTVYAAGSQVNQSATPSATLTPPKPTATPTPVKSKPTATPTPKSAVATATNTPAPTATPKPGVPTPTPTTIPAHPTNLPPTGSNDGIVLGITGIATTVVGILIFFLTKGAVL